jgi:general transcriptional corepressor TUP1
MPPNGAPGSVPQQKRSKPSVSAPPPGTRPSGGKPGSVATSSAFNDMDLETIPPGFKKEGTDWFAL